MCRGTEAFNLKTPTDMQFAANKNGTHLIGGLCEFVFAIVRCK